MAQSENRVYTIPLRLRRIENLHIVLWLFKDISWCLLWKELGIAMFLPTLVAAVYMAWNTKVNPADFHHNLAVVCWITANGYWMITEFFGFDETPVLSWIEGKHFALIPFLLGIGILARYYLYEKTGKIKKPQISVWGEAEKGV
ncbi:MAG: hypothetical protein N2747_09610 [Chitinophagaceae bacterium]|nr:hypothetical protein [Chitinophagaceae bacterium]